jgi:hypothetical protein
MAGAAGPHKETAMDYSIVNRTPDVAQAMVGHFVDANGNAVPASTATPSPVSATAAEQVFSPAITSGGVYSAGYCLGAPQTITSGGSLRHLSVDWNTSQTQNLSALVFRAAPASSTLVDHSAASIAAADVGKVVDGGLVLSATVLPGGSGTVWLASGIDLVVSSGAQIQIVAGGTMNPAGAATSGLTIGAGIV